MAVMVAACGSSESIPASLTVSSGAAANNTSVKLQPSASTEIASSNTQLPPNSPNVGSSQPAIAAELGEKWSDPKTWGGIVPPDGSNVLIPKGKVVLLDQAVTNLALLTVEGHLIIDDKKPISISAGNIVVKGTFEAGTVAVPRTNPLSITLNGTSQEPIAGMGGRGFFVDGGRISLVSKQGVVPWTKLSANAGLGATALTTMGQTSWNVGDSIAIGPSDFYGTQQTEVKTISALRASGYEISTPLAARRYGQLQTLVGEALVETSSVVPFPVGNQTPTQFDSRAPVANLTRLIKIQAPDDVSWKANGLGAQFMIMGASSSTTIDGVELRRMGQAGLKGRYPIHFHQLSYDGLGNEIQTSTNRTVKNSSVWESSNRCVTLHGTNDVSLENNVCFDIKGHAIFLEDAVEKRNTFKNNLVLKVRVPQTLINNSDGPGHLRGPAGFWLTHPNNIVIGNHVADSEGTGFWLAYPRKPLGLNKLVNTIPDRTRFGQFDSNTAHSNFTVGIHFDAAPINDQGDTRESAYIPTVDDTEDLLSNRVSFNMSSNSVWKNTQGGFWNRVTYGNYFKWIAADNLGSYFFGANSGSIQNSLLVGTSKNSAINWAQIEKSRPPVGFATYNSTSDIINNTLLNFQYVDGLPSGAFKTDDYYVHPVEIGTFRNAKNTLINTHPGYRSRTTNQDLWALAGAILDPHGYWGPKNNYWVYDTPFFTDGQNCQQVLPVGQNGASCNNKYFGVTSFIVDGSDRYWPSMGIDATKLNTSGANVGSWYVPPTSPGMKLSSMRHFAAVKNGRYVLKFTNLLPKVEALATIENFSLPDDQFMLAISFSGLVPAKVYSTSLWNYTWEPSDPRQKINMTGAGSLAEVEASNGDKFWQDSANDLVWVKVKSPHFAEIVNPDSNGVWLNMYRPFYVRVYK